MKASEALRKGATMVEPVLGKLIDTSTGKCCALGMIGKAVNGHASTGAASTYPWIRTHVGKLPCDCHEATIMGPGGACAPREYVERDVWNVVTHLFNYHVMTEGDWSVGDIADWLDKVDPSNQVVNNDSPVANETAVR